MIFINKLILKIIYAICIIIGMCFLVAMCEAYDTNNVPKQPEIVQPIHVEEIIPEPTYAYNITPEEREMLARLIFLEANTESLDCQKAVTYVIINRWQNGYWGNTLHDVVYAKGQFTPAAKIPYTTPTSINYEAVDYVIQNGVTVPQYVLYFRVGYHHKWKGYRGYIVYDHTYFGYMEKDMNQ